MNHLTRQTICSSLGRNGGFMPKVKHLVLKSWFYVLHWILLFLVFFKTYHFRFFSSFGSIQHSTCHSQKSQKSSDLPFLCSQNLKKKRCMCYVDCNHLRKKNLQNGFQKNQNPHPSACFIFDRTKKNTSP